MTVPYRRFTERAGDFAWCEDVIRRNSKSFYRAFSLLPKCKRESVFALYAFCRAADDCVDVEASEASLDALERDLERFLSGLTRDEPMWRAMDVVFESFDLDEQPFFDMIEGQRRDLSFRQPQTIGDLEEYGYYVAGSVGLMLLPILHSRSAVSDGLKQSAIDLGVAMQITNILRDVGEDLDSGRVYLPRDAMREAGYSQPSLTSAFSIRVSCVRGSCLPNAPKSSTFPCSAMSRCSMRIVEWPRYHRCFCIGASWIRFARAATGA